LTELRATPERPWLEAQVLTLMLVIFFGLNLATSSRFPLPWQDEDMFVDVAANYAAGRGFTSSVYMCGDPVIGHFWSCNAPMFPFVLGGWIKVFGFDIAPVRSLNYILISMAVLVLWFAMRRLALIRSAAGRLLFAGLLLTGYGMGFIYRSARYDCLGMLLLSLVVLAYSIASKRMRIVAIALLGVLLPFAGIQLILFSVVLSALLLVFLRQRVFWEIFALGSGIAVGLGSLLLLFYGNGVLPNFFSSVFGERSGRFQYVAKDPSFVLLAGVCLVLVLERVMRRTFRFLSPMGVGFACGVLIPVCMLVLGKFPIYYTWMAYVPLAIAAAAGISDRSFQSSRLVRSLSACGLVLACLIGLPVEVASAVYYWNDRDCSRIDTLVQQNLKPGDWVYTQYAGYFAVKKVTPNVFIPFEIARPYRDRITVLLVSPDDYNVYAHAIVGGEWQDTGIGIPDTGHDLLAGNSLALLLQRRINLRIYRRVVIPAERPASAPGQ
jgi:hypothetical protein